jgi:LysM repeat protein
VRAGVARFAAPAAFLLAATLAVLLIRNGLERGGGSERTTTSVAARPTSTPTTAPAPAARPRRRFYVIQSGDTFGSVSVRFSVPVSKLLQLNPGVDPAALTVGQRIRVR